MFPNARSIRRLVMVTLTTIAALLIVTLPTFAQIEVRQATVGPDEEQYFVLSWGLRDDPPDQYPHGLSTAQSLGEAQAKAQGMIDRTRNNGYWAITHVLIQGETRRIRSAEKRKEAVEATKKAAEAAKKVGEAKELGDKTKNIAEQKADERKVGTTLREYANRATIAYQQAKYLKDKLTKMTGEIPKSLLERANKLIDQFNKAQSDLDKNLPASGPLRDRYGAMLFRQSPMAALKPGDLKGRLVDKKVGVLPWNEIPKIVDARPKTYGESEEPKKQPPNVGYLQDTSWVQYVHPTTQICNRIRFNADGTGLWSSGLSTSDPNSNRFTWAQTGNSVQITVKQGEGFEGSVARDVPRPFMVLTYFNEYGRWEVQYARE